VLSGSATADRKRKNLGLALLLAAAGIASVVAATPAIADLILTINNPNSGLSGFTGPYATVDIAVAPSGTSATVTFTSLDSGGYLYRMGDGGTADLNINGAYTLQGTITALGFTGGFTPDGSAITNNPGNVDGFGFFDLSLNSPDGFTDSATSVSFTVTKNSGAWATDGSDFLLANSQGSKAAVHAFACANTCTQLEGAATTGFAANGGAINIVPEPTSLSIFATALIALGGLGLFRRRRSKYIL
jgi:hypothetical protein